MRKGKGTAKKLGIYAHYEVKGLNQDYLINLLQKKGVWLYYVKKISNKKMRFSINAKQIENFFAITNNLCYNIKRIKLHGKNMPVYLAVRNFGVIVGALILTVFSTVFSDYLLDVEFTGNGKILEREVTSFLEQEGVVKYSKFSRIDLSTLEDKILASNSNLTFASCKKHGNKMIVELVLSENAVKSPIGTESEIVSDVHGVIEDLKVYRGTALKNVGDYVEIGDCLVDGTANVKDEIIEVNPIAYISIIVEENIEYFSQVEIPEESFLASIESEKEDLDLIGISVVKKEIEGGYYYIATVNYRHVIYR